LFFEQLKIGREGEIKVANRLMMSGIPVQLPALRVRSNVDKRFEYRDQADLWAGPWRSPKRIEVKHVKVEFTSVLDFPFDDVAVVTSHKWERVKNSSKPPMCFVIVSQKTGGMFTVPTSMSKEWFEKSVRDSVRNIDVDIMCASKAHCKSIEELIYYLRVLSDDDLP